MPLNETLLNKSTCLIPNPPIIIPVLYFFIFPTSLALNGVAAWVSLYLNSKATFVVYLKNLLAADLIMTAILPFDAMKDLSNEPGWLLVLMCRYLSTIFYSTMYTSISLLGLISVDRWLKIMMPRNRLLCHNIQFGKFMSAAVWVVLFGFTSLPNVILTNRSLDSSGEVKTCMDLKGPLGLEVHQLIIICLNVYFWIVSVLMVVCYVCIAHKVIESFKRSGSNNKQGKQRMKHRVFSVVIVFFISFSPYHIVRIPYTFQQVSSYDDDCSSYVQGKFAKQVSLFLATANICLSPLLYAFLCNDFRMKLISLLKDLDIPLPIDLNDKASSASTQPSNKAPAGGLARRRTGFSEDNWNRKQGRKGSFTQRTTGKLTGIVTRQPHSSSRDHPFKMNSSQSNTSIKCFRDTSVTSVVFPCLYSLLFIVALVLNSLAAWTFFRIPSTSTFVVFLKNVVVADFLMTLTIPVRILSDAGVGFWYIRAFHCRYSAVLFYITMYVSIILLGLISLDRYLKIVRPFGKSILQRVRVGQMISVAVWVVVFCLAIPNCILSNQPPKIIKGKLKCSSMKSKLGLYWHEGFNYFCQVVFWGTLLLMVVCYTFISKKVYESYKASKSSSQAANRRTKAKVFVVVGVFFICFAPYHFARVPYTLTQTRSAVSHCQAQNALYIAKETTLWLSASNVCLDPLIYVFLCKLFRRRLTAALCRKPLQMSGVESHTATSTQLELTQGVSGRQRDQ
ncbi:uncharacterized protein ACB057_008755 [Neosynchiropus ocellatus]